jgi:hypothetical protein
MHLLKLATPLHISLLAGYLPHEVVSAIGEGK